MLEIINDSGKSDHIFNIVEKIAFSLLIMVGLIAVANYNVAIFHTVVENIGVVVGGCVLIISLHTYKITQDRNFNLIGLTYGFAALFEFSQALYSPNLSISLQFSIFARFFQCLLLTFLFVKSTKSLNIKRLFYFYTILAALMFCSVYSWNIIPDHNIVNGIFSSSYTISCKITLALFIFSIIFIAKTNNQKNPEVKRLLTAYCILMILYQSSILIDILDTDIHLIVTHLIKFFCNYPIFIIVTKLAFKEPIKVFFTDLSSKNEQLAKKEALLEKQNHELIIKNKALVHANSIISVSHQRYKKLLHFLPDAVLLLKGTEIVFANNKFREMFQGILEDTLLNKNILEVVPKRYSNILKTQLDSVYSGNNIHSKEAKFEISPERTLEVEYTIIYNVLDDDNYALIIMEDITEKKQAQEILTRARINEENEQLKIGFLANISHELRTPINLIYSAIQLEDQYIPMGKTSDIQRYNKVIKQNCFRLLRIINNLIDATKIDASFFKTNMKYMNIISVIEECTLSVVSFIESKSMSLVFDTDLEEKYMIFDPDLIERIVLNLLANSVKYGVYEGTIYVNIQDCSDHLNIYFKDDGVGIPKDKLDMLFNRFTRIDKSFSRNTEGSGIGLYLVKQFVEMHSGHITVNSEEGNGLEVCISLPYAPNSALPFEEIKLAAADLAENSNIIDKVNIEFSDIYME